MDGPARTLILLAKAPHPPASDSPRHEYLELARAVGAEILDFNDVAASTHPLVRAGAWFSPLAGLAVLGFLRRSAFDRFYATGEDIAIPFGALLRASGRRGRLTAVIHRCDTPNRSLALRGVGHEVFANILCLATAQRRALISELGIPSQKVHRLDQWVDTAFFSPSHVALADGPGEYVLACGRESRDYPTLTKAVAALDLRVRVVASGWASHAGFDPATGIAAQGRVEVTSGLSYAELREAYARARFVVVPLESVTYPAGVTSICEAMAMGKAIVATASPGILDYVKPGLSGLLVPPGDEVALREAMWSLWNDPRLCQTMGEHNRRWSVESFATGHYVDRVAGMLSPLVGS